MAQLRRRLPPVNSLVVLEAAGRLLNFTRAGEELALTQSAVSRQIQLLEQHLGAAMFQRQGRHLQLTRDGARLHRAVTMGLDHIADIAVDIRRHRGTGELTVATSVTFASYWLMARLAQFRSQHPDIELRLVASTKMQDLVAAGVDIAIRYGSGEWEGLEAIRIFDNEIWPVCAPGYLAGRPSLTSGRGHARRDAPASEPVRPQLGHLAGLAGCAGRQGHAPQARPGVRQLSGTAPGRGARRGHRTLRRAARRGLHRPRRPDPPDRGDAHLRPGLLRPLSEGRAR